MHLFYNNTINPVTLPDGPNLNRVPIYFFLSPRLSKSPIGPSVSQKIVSFHLIFQDKLGDISDDETVQFKSYLLNLGIADPVTRDAFGTDKKYFEGVAKEIFLILEEPVRVRARKECVEGAPLHIAYMNIVRVLQMGTFPIVRTHVSKRFLGLNFSF